MHLLLQLRLLSVLPVHIGARQQQQQLASCVCMF
jgi:hypothetical protein